MPQISFKSENKKASVNYDFPKLKLKKGERARIAVLTQPDVQYTHNFRKPVMENGKPKMETAQRRDKSEYQTNVMAFVRNPICLGDWATLEDKGSDPEHCPACKMAKDNPDWMQAPKRRFAMHVIRYRTKSGGFGVSEPFAVETLVWSFPDRVFNKLADFTEEAGGDLKTVDLMLGPCENEGFQKFDIAMAQKAEWSTEPARKKLTVETLKGGMIPDLSIAIGNTQTEHYMKQDLEDIAEAWMQVSGADRAEASAAGQDLSAGLDNLFNDDSKSTTEAQTSFPETFDAEPDAPAAKSAPSSTDDEDLSSLLDSAPSEGDASDSAPAAEEKKSDAPADDFDSLLDSI